MAGIDNNTLLYLRGDSFTDLSPNNITVTNNGVTVVDNMLNFDGVNDLLSVPNNIDFDNDFTIEFYFHKSSSTYGYYKTILGNSPSNAVQGITLFVESDSTLGCEFGFTTGKYQFRTSTTAFNNSLTHIAFVKNGSDYAFFVNGVKIATYSNSNSIIKNSLPFTFGKNRDCLVYLNMKLYNVRFSNIARYTENFTPSTQPYNSIIINKTNQTDTNIEFSIEKLGQETINKVEVLINNSLSETYTDNYDSIDYVIDTELCDIGENNITIRVTYDNNYAEEKVITYKHTVPPLPQEAPLLDTVERVKALVNSKEAEKNMLSSILTSKNVEVSEEDKMSDLIGKVDLLGDAPPPPLYLYKDGDECTDVTGGWGHSYLYNASYNITETPILQKNSDHIYMEQHQGSTAMGQRSAITTKNSISLSNYSKLLVEVSINSAYDNIFMVRSNYLEGKQSNLGDSIINFVIKDANVTNKIYKLDITSVSSGYIQYQLHTVGGTKSTKIHKIWLEK